MINTEVKEVANLGLLTPAADDLTHVWRTKPESEPSRFINDDFSVSREVLNNFRRLMVFGDDFPSWQGHKYSLKNILGAGHRGRRKILRNCLTVLNEHGYRDLATDHPCPPTGNPQLFEYQGLKYTFRWIKHVYFLGLLNRVLGNVLSTNFTCLDIGSGYGSFSNLVKREYPQSHQILVDFPEQLVLAHYFLGKCFPNARIAGIGTVANIDTVTREFVQDYDFVLVPTTLFSKLSGGSADLVANFTSFGEMSRTWFDKYIKSSTFQTAKFFFTSNRIQSMPDYDTELTILDYPIWDPVKKLHFGICPLWSNRYLQQFLFQ